MRTVTRLPSLALSLLLLAAPMTGCTREGSRMDPEMARQAFPGDARMAQIALAVAGKDVDAVRRLAPGVELDAHGDKDVTLLQWAVLAASPAGFEALLDAGADPHAHGMDGETAVHTAVRVEDPVFLRMLVTRGADLDARADGRGHSPLSTALLSGADENVSALLRAGANPDIPDRMGDTPLHVASQIGIAGLVIVLLDAGADPTIRNRRGRTFDFYLFDRPDELLSDQGRREHAAIRERLQSRGGAIEEEGT